MKTQLLMLLMAFGFLSAAFAQSWTAKKPLKATLISIASGCAEFRTPEGKRFFVKQASLEGFNLIPGKSEIRFYEESLPPHLCSANNQ